MAETKDVPTPTAPNPNKKKVMYGVLGLAGIVLLYVYFKNKNSSSSSTLTTGGAIDPLTGQPYQAGVGSLASTGSGIQGMSSGGNLIIKNIMHTSGGTGSTSGTTTTQPTITTGSIYNPGPSSYSLPTYVTPSYTTPTSPATPTSSPTPSTILGAGTKTPVGIIGQTVSSSQAKANALVLSQTQQMRNLGL